MKALLLYPEARDIFFNLKHTLRVLGKKALLPPVGLLTAASVLPREWDKRFVDLHVREPTDAEIAWADYAFVSITAGRVQDDSALEVIRRCKAAGVKVVVGGPGFYPDDEGFAGQMRKYADVDHFVLGEAETALPLFLRDLGNGGPKRVYRAEGYADVTASPMPMWELLELGDYAQMAMQLVRGCPYDCDFCLVPPLMGRPGRAKTVEQFLGELQHIYDLGWRGFIELNDDNLIADIKMAKRELLPALGAWQSERGMPFRFHVCVDSRVGEDEELLGLLWKAGFHSLFLGIENLNQGSLAEVHKRVNKNRDMEAVVRRIHRAGIFAYSGLMVGFDHDEESVFDDMIEFTDRTGIVMPSLTKVNALPGTKLHARLNEAGRIDPDVTPGVAHRSNVLGVPMGERMRDDGYIRLMMHLWDPGSFYGRVRTALREFPSEVHQQRPSREDVVILLRILLHVGVLGRERAHFWKLIGWTLAKRPELLGAALSVAPLGHGFRKRSEEVFGARTAGRLFRRPRLRRPNRRQTRGGTDVRVHA